jgi:hypothetical protein
MVGMATVSPATPAMTSTTLRHIVATVAIGFASTGSDGSIAVTLDDIVFVLEQNVPQLSIPALNFHDALLAHHSV